MPNTPFVDYYQLLNCAPESTLETIDRHFRQLIEEFRGDSSQTNVNRFATLAVAYETLKAPELRKKYDADYRAQANKSQSQSELTMDDTNQRLQILSQLYAKRRSNMKNPGLPSSSLAELTGCEELVIDFHLWYFVQKGWVQREESGVYSITATGVDRIDEINLSSGFRGQASDIRG